MVLTIAAAGAALALVVLLHQLWTQRRRHEQLRSHVQENAWLLLEIERAGKIGHWFMDEASQTMTWSA